MTNYHDGDFALTAKERRPSVARVKGFFGEAYHDRAEDKDASASESRPPFGSDVHTIPQPSPVAGGGSVQKKPNYSVSDFVLSSESEDEGGDMPKPIKASNKGGIVAGGKVGVSKDKLDKSTDDMGWLMGSDIGSDDKDDIASDDDDEPSEYNPLESAISRLKATTSTSSSVLKANDETITIQKFEMDDEDDSDDDRRRRPKSPQMERHGQGGSIYMERPKQDYSTTKSFNPNGSTWNGGKLHDIDRDIDVTSGGEKNSNASHNEDEGGKYNPLPVRLAGAFLFRVPPLPPVVLFGCCFVLVVCCFVLVVCPPVIRLSQRKNKQKMVRRT
jgi:hypothetical protein